MKFLAFSDDQRFGRSSGNHAPDCDNTKDVSTTGILMFQRNLRVAVVLPVYVLPLVLSLFTSSYSSKFGPLPLLVCFLLAFR